MPIPFPPLRGDLPPIHIGTVCTVHRSNAIAWRDLQTPATNGRVVGVGGCSVSLWSIANVCTAQMNLVKPVWHLPGVPGIYNLYLTAGTRSSTSGSLLTCAEHTGPFACVVGDDSLNPPYKEFSHTTTQHVIAVDGYSMENWALWTGDGSGEVRILNRDFAQVFATNISTYLTPSTAVTSMAYFHPNLVVVTSDSATSRETILLADMTTRNVQVLATDLRNVSATVNHDTVVWSQVIEWPWFSTSSQLFYWRQGLSLGGRLLFTPQAGFDLKYPQAMGNSLAFVQGWPVKSGQTRADRKTALLIYDLDLLPQLNPTTCEIDDMAIWSDVIPLYSVFATLRTSQPNAFVAYFKHPPAGSSVTAPHLTLVCIP